MTDEDQDLSSADVIAEIRHFFEDQLVQHHGSGDESPNWEELPPFLKKKPYRFNSHVVLPFSYQKRLLLAIDPHDVLMIRGLSHLVKCGMLTSLGRAFVDTACLEIYVALEATLEIILERLRTAGNPNPSNRDASDYLLEGLNEPYRLDRYFSDYYDDRIKAIHPKSRFGAAKFTPLYVDDLYMLYNDLLRTFEFLITGVPHCYTEYRQPPNNELERARDG